jgi:hypothetical protein
VRTTATDTPASFLWAVRKDPAHTSELAVLYTMTEFATHVARWRAGALRDPGVSAEQRAKRVVRRAARVARGDGVVCGSSFYLGMPAAVISIFCHQVVLVLEIAALFDRDPTDPARAAEVLVLKGRAKSIEDATEALRAARSPSAGAARPPLRRVLTQSLRQLPAMLGLKLRRLKSGHPIDAIVTVCQWASYLVPVVGMPACAISSARATKKLGADAIAFYSRAQAGVGATPGLDPEFTLPPRPSGRRRRRLVAAVLATAVALVVLVVALSGGINGLKQHLLLTGVCELFLIATFGRLLWTTRPPRPHAPNGRD